ncbi:MAG: hypothetical protein M3270_04240 [Thermoproteota archaeon]|nr:hypothetical protein [Thermoproteota archaeon]
MPPVRLINDKASDALELASCGLAHFYRCSATTNNERKVFGTQVMSSIPFTLLSTFSNLANYGIELSLELLIVLAS